MTITEIMDQIRTLSREEKQALVQQVMAEIDAPEEKTHSILELRGLGKEIWQGIDAQEYVNKLRDEWDEKRS